MRENAIFNKLYKVIFIVGIPPVSSGPTETARLEQQLENEIRIYGDIFKVDIVESYHNITLKVIVLYEFMIKMCSDVKFHIKGDDDILINIEKLHEKITAFIRNRHNEELFMYGAALYGVGPLKAKSWKWYVPDHIHPHQKWGWDYLAGSGYIQPVAVTKLLYSVALCLNLLFVDDAYFTGYLRFHLRIRIEWANDIYTTLLGPFTAEKYRTAIIAPQMGPPELNYMWKVIKSGTTSPKPLTIAKTTKTSQIESLFKMSNNISISRKHLSQINRCSNF